MSVFRVWCVLWVLCYVGANLDEYELSYEDDYDNEISEDQQEGESPEIPCKAADFSRWNKLFTALEDSLMRQNMLLESLDHCCGGMATIRTQVERLAKGTCQQCLPSLELACRVQMEQTSLRLQRGLAELRDEGAEREKRINSTLHQLLDGSNEQDDRLKRLKRRVEATGPITPRPGGLGVGLDLGVKPLSSDKEQEVTSPLDMAEMARALVAISLELQRVHVQLNRLMERVTEEEER